MRNIIPRRIAAVSLSISASLLGDSALYTILPAHAEQLGIRLALVGILISYLLLSVQVGIEYLYLGGLMLLVAACIL
jgi:hypothetical protein